MQQEVLKIKHNNELSKSKTGQLYHEDGRHRIPINRDISDKHEGAQINPENFGKV